MNLRSKLSMHVVMVVLLKVLVGVAVFAAETRAQEKLGEVEVHDFFVEPSFSLTEPHTGDFKINAAYIAARWKFDDLLLAHFKFGTTQLLGRPARYAQRSSEEFGLLEGYLQASTVYLGRVRFGLVPIAFGLEGAASEPYLIFPRSLFYQRRLLNIRDLGVSYSIDNEGFYSDWAVHNGEGGANLDNEMWFTARWGWQGGRFFRGGFSGATGRTTPASTNPLGTHTSDVAGLEVNEDARIRMANFFAFWQDAPVVVAFEVTAGEVTQSTAVRKFRALHFDAEYGFHPNLFALARYEAFDPETDSEGDRLQEATVGMVMKSRYRLSSFFVLGTKALQEGATYDEHRLQLIWRMTPTATDGRSPL